MSEDKWIAMWAIATFSAAFESQTVRMIAALFTCLTIFYFTIHSKRIRG